MAVLTLVVLSIVLSAPFGPAEAAAIDDSDGLTVEVDVAVEGSFEVVLVRPFSSFEELPPTALVDRGDGRWGGLVQLPTVEDWSVVFDAIDPDGESIRSDPTSLTQLGVDPIVVAAPPSEPVPSEPVSATTWWLLAGIVLAFAALGVLAWWTFAGDDSDDADADEGDVGVGDLTNGRD